MKTLITLFLTTIVLTTTAQLQTPQWELPIYITDETGVSDTVYLGIDPLATMGYDSLFEDTTYRPPLDSVGNGKLHVVLVGGAPIRSKRTVLPPDPEGHSLGLMIHNVEGAINIETEIWILGDTLHGVKNMKWDEQLQKEVPDKYKGAQIWVDAEQYDPGLLGPCGFHGGLTTRFVGGKPELPSMKSYPICTPQLPHKARYSILYSEPGEKYYFIFPLDLKPMNILGSPLLAIEELEDFNVQVYPNPVKNMLTINNQDSDPLTVVIYDNLSREVKRLGISSFEILQTDISDLPSGMYLVELRNSKSSAFKKVLKY